MNKELLDLLTGLNENFDNKIQFLILQLVVECFDEFEKRRDAVLNILNGIDLPCLPPIENENIFSS
jgi:hypothetical protein